MNIYVCVKHVPDTAATIRIGSDDKIEENITFIMNPYDENALEEAVRLKRQVDGAEVIAVMLAKETAEGTLRSALAMGADRAILIQSGKFHDSITTARALGEAIRRDGIPDIIFTGKESIDSEGFQTMFHLGACLDMPVVTNTVSFELKAQKVSVLCELEAGAREHLEMTLPCVIGAGKDLNQPSYPKLPDILKAKKKQIAVVDLDELAIAPSTSRVEMIRLEPAVEDRQTKTLEGSAEEVADAIVGILRQEAKVME